MLNLKKLFVSSLESNRMVENHIFGSIRASFLDDFVIFSTVGG